jgi:hypothetical protein
VVSVRDRLIVGSLDRDRTDRLRSIVLGEGANPLRFFGARGSFNCRGDESRLCCLTPAFGQLVVATGELGGSKETGWFIRDPEVCDVLGGK